MLKKINHFIDNKMVIAEGNVVQTVYNPALGVAIAEVSAATPAEINQAILSAETAFVKWSEVTPLKRARILFKFKALLEEHIDILAELLTTEHGKVLEDARGEVLRAIELVEFMCGIPYLLRGNYSENVGTEVDSYTIRQPLGICVGITPFNFPVMISTWMFASAIACGNSFILKPSEKNPSAPLFLAELMMRAGLPPGVLNVIQGDKNTVHALITHPNVVAVSAVGSTPVAETIYHTAIQQGKRAHTFGGAKNHCVVMPDANIQESAEAILGAAFGAAGERCMAISVVIAVTDAVADQLIVALKTKLQQLKISSGMEAKVDMGPLISREHLERVKSYVDLGVEEGAELIVDGRKFSPSNYADGFFMGGCLFDHVTETMRIYQEEIFGPVLVVMRVATFKAALDLINKHSFGNGVALFTQDGGIARTFASQVKVGMVGINVAIPVPVAYHTFGGWKRSLFGDLQMHGTESIQFYTKSKTVTARWPKNSSTINFHMTSH